MTPSPLSRTLAERTLELVRIPSPSGEERAIADHVHRFLQDRTSATHLIRHPSGVVARYGEAAPGLVLVGHLDTVPSGDHPEPVLGEDSVVGLGATDMKGALAVMLTLAEKARASSRGARGLAAPPDDGPVSHADHGPASLALVFYDNEEVAFEKNGLRPLFDAEPWLAEADLALLLEPTDNAVELGCLGTIHAEVLFAGRAGHTARPWTGENAIHKAAPFLSRIAAIEPREVIRGPVSFTEVLSVTLARGGTARNVIPDRFVMNLNFRFAPDRSETGARDHLRSLLPEGAELTVTDSAPAAEPRHDAPLLRKFIDENSLEIRAKQAWTDVAQFSERGVVAANFGPGHPELAHRRDEQVSVANLVRCYEVLAGFLGLDRAR